MQKLKEKFWCIRIRFRILIQEWLQSRDVKRNHKNKLESEILVYAHSLEKGMGIRNSRIGYGKEKAKKLVGLLNEYICSGYNTNVFAIGEAVAILHKYVALMEIQNVDIYGLKKCVEEFDKMYDNIAKPLNAGSVVYTKNDLMKGTGIDFETLVQTRHSIRMYSDSVISEDEIEKIVELANTAPSACNRQPTHVYYTKTQESAHALEKIIQGSRSFEGEVPYYMIITTDRAYFSADECLQWYINGGIYLGFLSLACHSRGIGSIILQWKFGTKNEEIKHLIGIPENEAIVALMGFGRYCEGETKCIVAQRRSGKDVLHGFDLGTGV